MNGYAPTELDHCVMAVIWRIQPCTAYQVRRAFQASLTASWRASTGSIYPILRKLVANGLVEGAAVPDDRRGSRQLTIGNKGAEALRAWLTDHSSWIAEPVADPIRTRSYVLSMLPAAQAASLVAHWKTETEGALLEIRQRLSQYAKEENAAEQIAHRGTELQLAARLTWLDELESGLWSPCQ